MDTDIANQFLFVQQKFEVIEIHLSDLSDRLKTMESSNEHHITQLVYKREILFIMLKLWPVVYTVWHSIARYLEHNI